jgi:hypothetical protein
MKALLVLLFVALPAFGQNQPSGTAVAPGCGPAKTEFEVTTGQDPHPSSRATDGKALVYFLQDDKEFASRPRPTVRFGVDGAWAGATHSNSYFYVSVDPGEHHLCASWQGEFSLTPQRRDAAFLFTAEAGHVYYFRADDSSRLPGVIFKPVNSDEALLLMSKFLFSTSHPKN